MKEIHIPFFIEQSKIYFSNKDQILLKFRKQTDETKDLFAEKEGFLQAIKEFEKKISRALNDIPNQDSTLWGEVAECSMELEKFYGRSIEFHKQILYEYNGLMYLQRILENSQKILEIQNARVPLVEEYQKKK